MNRISLCMICGNEAGLILGCLQSAADAFDELCLVRAIGEQVPDKTVELARIWCAANGKSFQTDEYSNSIPGLEHVDNFGAARQRSFTIATGDWVFWLDCDDLMAPETPSRIRELVERPGVRAWKFSYQLGGGAHSVRERLFRRGVGHWVGVVHETFELSVPVEADGVATVIHSPVQHDRESSHTRNLALLRTLAGNSSRTLFYLHEELYWQATQRGDGAAQRESIEVGKAALAMSMDYQLEERYEIFLNLGELEKGKEEYWWLEALRLQPWRREALSYLCQHAIALGRRPQALSWFRMMDTLPEPNPLPWTHRGIWHGWARNYLRVRVLRLAGQFEQAATEHEEHLKSPAYAKGVAEHEKFTPSPNPGGPKILIICPTRERADRCAIMLDSFLSTRQGNTEIICYVDELDPQADQYRRMFSERSSPNITYQFGPRLTLVQICNKFSSEMEADFYGDVNDDHIYRTPGWDLKLMAAIQANGGTGLAYGRTENLPGATMVSANCIRALGYYYPPCFHHQYADNVQRDIYTRLGMMFYVPEVWIEHCHPAFGKAKMDHTYQPMMDAHDHDAAAYIVWKETEFDASVQRILNAVLAEAR